MCCVCLLCVCVSECACVCNIQCVCARVYILKICVLKNVLGMHLYPRASHAAAFSNYCAAGCAMASLTHFFVKLARAAPASFFSVAARVQDDVAASRSHFFMKLVRAAPASFFSAAVPLQLSA